MHIQVGLSKFIPHKGPESVGVRMFRGAEKLGSQNDHLWIPKFMQPLQAILPIRSSGRALMAMAVGGWALLCPTSANLVALNQVICFEPENALQRRALQATNSIALN